jgi:hypothetical protein
MNYTRSIRKAIKGETLPEKLKNLKIMKEFCIEYLKIYDNEKIM